MRLFTCLFFFLMATAARSQQIKLIKDDILEEYMKNGYADKHFRPEGKYNKDKQREGFWKDYEVVKDFTFQMNNNEPSRVHGQYLVYGEGAYIADKKTGPWTFYSIENKTNKKILLRKVTYVNGVGEGMYQCFFANGKPAESGSFKHGSRQGADTLFYDSGEVFGIQQLNNDKGHGAQQYFYRSGKPYFTARYEYGVIEGRNETWYEDGNPKEVVNYFNGKTDGVYKYYYPGGQLWTERIYQSGKLMNVTALFDKNGKSLDIGNFKDGNGIINFYNESGKIYQRNTYKDGEKIKEDKQL